MQIQMTTTIALLTFIAGSANKFILNDAALEKVKAIAKGCQEKSQIEEDQLKKIRSNIVVEDDEAKNYYHCVFTEMDWVKGDTFHTDKFKKDIKQDLAFDVIEPCNRSGSAGAQLSCNIYKCLTEHIEAGYQTHL